jgi:hypothetical protein
MFGILYTSSCAIAQREKDGGRYAADLFLQLPARGPVPLRFSALRALRAKLRSGLLSSANIGPLDNSSRHYRRKNRRDGHQDDQSQCDAEDSVDQRVTMMLTHGADYHGHPRDY